MILNNLVSHSQSTFLSSRQLLDDVFVLYEIIDITKKEKNECMLLKVNFKQAYEYVSWNYLRFVLRNISCGVNWMKWMKAGIFRSTMSVLVNESPKEDLKVERELRQGDLYPLFFFL